MAAKTEVSAVFKLDDQSKAAMDKIKSGFGNLSDAADKAQAGVVGFFKEAAATALGFQLAMSTGKLFEMGKEAFTKALDLENTQKHMTGLMSLTAKAGTDWDTLAKKANVFNSEMDRFAARTGIAKNTATELYTTLANTFNTSRSFITASGQSINMPLNQWEKAFKRSDEDIAKLMRNIGTAGRAVAGGPEALAQSFNNFSAQGAKATDPIVQMIAATGTLKGNAKQVAQQLNLLTDASAMSFAQVAIGKMAKQMVGVPATFQTVMQQLGTMKDRFLEGFGKPIIAAVVPALDRFKEKLEANKGVIESFVRMFSEKVTKYISEAAKAIEKGFDYVVTHADEIKHAISQGFEMAEKVFKFILAHKEEIAVAFGAKAAIPAVTGAVGTLTSAGTQAATAASAVGAAHIAKGSMGAGAAGALGATATGLAAFGAAVVGVGAAVYQATQYMKEFGAVLPWHVEANDNLLATMDAAAGWANGTREATAKDYDMLRKRVFEFGESAGYTQKELKSMADAMDRLYEEGKKNQAVINKAQDAADMMRDTMNARHDMAKEGVKQDSNEAYMEDVKQLEQFIDAYSTAVVNGNKVQMQTIAKMFEGNVALQQMFLKAGTEVQGGFELLASMVGDGAEDFKKKLMGLAEAPAMKQNPKVEFNNNTFNLKQDFRDQDPDRIAMIFQRDIINAAENRRNAKVGGVFGP